MVLGMLSDLCIKHPENNTELSDLIDICVKSRLGVIINTIRRDDDHLPLVAVNHGRVIGGLVCYVYSSELEADLDVIAVDEDFRRIGVGTKLLERLKAELVSRGVKILRVVPREGTEDYYARKGFSFDPPSSHYMTQWLE